MAKVLFLERTIDIRLKDSHQQYEMRTLSETLTVHCWPVCIIHMNHADEHLYTFILDVSWNLSSTFSRQTFLFLTRSLQTIVKDCNDKYVQKSLPNCPTRTQ